jgi:hypothetical protein
MPHRGAVAESDLAAGISPATARWPTGAGGRTVLDPRQDEHGMSRAPT